MRILKLATSDDLQPSIPEDQRSPQVMRRILESELTEPVDLVLRPFWPSAELPAILDGWLSRYEPDLLFLSLPAFPFTYPFAPLKLGRKLGARGERVATRLCLNDSGSSWVFRTSAFHLLRTVSLRVIGGVTFMEPELAIDIQARMLRLAVARERIAVVQRGPHLTATSGLTASALRSAEARTSRVAYAVQELCRTLQVEYIPRDPTAVASRYLAPDRVHRNALYHADLGALEAAAVLRAWRRHKATDKDCMSLATRQSLPRP